MTHMTTLESPFCHQDTITVVVFLPTTTQKKAIEIRANVERWKSRKPRLH